MKLCMFTVATEATTKVMFAKGLTLLGGDTQKIHEELGSAQDILH
jgi:hypothetical protein